MRHKDPKADCIDNINWVKETIKKVINKSNMQSTDQAFNRGTLLALFHSLDIEDNPKMRLLKSE